LNLNWTSASLSFNDNVNDSRLRDVFTSYPQNVFGSDEVLNWLPTNRPRATADSHQQNLLNNSTPYYGE
jgi:hypothetical protein